MVCIYQLLRGSNWVRWAWSMDKTIYTIGYGGWGVGDFKRVLIDLGVSVLIDVRRWNKSRTLPEYSGLNLASLLREAGIEYIWLPELGGYRKFGVDVENYGIAGCFESTGFRAYATYIARRSDLKPLLSRLVEIASVKTTVLMCSERSPWACHRKILSDYFVVKGFRVLHILDLDRIVEHSLSKCAVVKNGELDYI